MSRSPVFTRRRRLVALCAKAAAANAGLLNYLDGNSKK